MQGLRRRPRIQFDPSKGQSKKRESETNRGHSDGAKKPFIENTTRDLRQCECVSTDGQRHNDNEECDSTKRKRPRPESKDRSKCATRNTIQHQQPGITFSQVPQSGCKSAKSCRQREHA